MQSREFMAARVQRHRYSGKQYGTADNVRRVDDTENFPTHCYHRDPQKGTPIRKMCPRKLFVVSSAWPYKPTHSPSKPLVLLHGATEPAEFTGRLSLNSKKFKNWVEDNYLL